MEFFSEIYGCYYQIVSEILKCAHRNGISDKSIVEITESLGFAESVLTVPDKLCFHEWQFLAKTDEKNYGSLLDNSPKMPLTLLQKRFLKTLLYDRRIKLFLDDTAFHEIETALSDVEPLWNDALLYYYDRYENGDDYSCEEYRKSFRLIIDACREKKALSFDYHSAKGKHSHKTCIPLKIEYSPKNDRFRLIALRCPFGKRRVIDRYRMDGIQNAAFSDSYSDVASMKKAVSVSADALMRQSYDAEPVRLLIQNKRNALERTMLHFANYDKDTKQLDENTWECLIYYDTSMGTELLIEILSFGPVVQVVGPDSFVELVRARLRSQRRLTISRNNLL